MSQSTESADRVQSIRRVKDATIDNWEWDAAEARRCDDSDADYYGWKATRDALAAMDEADQFSGLRPEDMPDDAFNEYMEANYLAYCQEHGIALCSLIVRDYARQLVRHLGAPHVPADTSRRCDYYATEDASPAFVAAGYGSGTEFDPADALDYHRMLLSGELDDSPDGLHSPEERQAVARFVNALAAELGSPVLPFPVSLPFPNVAGDPRPAA